MTSAGSVTSGINTFTLANVPFKPLAPENDPTGTNDSQIKVLYGKTLPNNGGSAIIGIQLFMDDGFGG